MFKRIGALGCGVLVLGLVAIGCGGGSDDSTNAGDAEAMQAFTRQANAICFKANSKAGAEIIKSYDLPKVRQSSSESEAIDFEVNIYVPILVKDADSQLKGIRALEVPGGEEDKVEALLKSYETWLDKADAAPLKVVIASDIYSQARELAGKMGLDKCEQTPYEEPYTTNALAAREATAN